MECLTPVLGLARPQLWLMLEATKQMEDYSDSLPVTHCVQTNKQTNRLIKHAACLYMHVYAASNYKILGSKYLK